MQLHHVSRRTFGALAVLILSAFVRFAHRVSIERVTGKPHLELLAGAVGMGRGSQHGQGQKPYAIPPSFFMHL